jgi:hypothetical protein
VSVAKGGHLSERDEGGSLVTAGKPRAEGDRLREREGLGFPPEIGVAAAARRGDGRAPHTDCWLLEVLGRRGDTKSRSEIERACVCQFSLARIIFLGNRVAKVMREIDFRGAPGPVAAARASVSVVLACGALRGAVGGSPRAAPHGYRKKRRCREVWAPRGFR